MDNKATVDSSSSGDSSSDDNNSVIGIVASTNIDAKKEGSPKAKSPAKKGGVKANPVTKAKQPKKRWKKPTDKPKRPLSAYNLFFQHERKLMIGPDNAKDDGSDDGKSEPKRRIHRKTHGKVSFGDMARIIGKKWKELDDVTRSQFEEQSEADKNRYFRELEVWKREQQQELQKHVEEDYQQKAYKPIVCGNKVNTSATKKEQSESESESESEREEEQHHEQEEEEDEMEEEEEERVHKKASSESREGSSHGSDVHQSPKVSENELRNMAAGEGIDLALLNEYRNLQQQRAQALALQNAAAMYPGLGGALGGSLGALGGGLGSQFLPPAAAAAASQQWMTAALLNQYLPSAAPAPAANMSSLLNPDYQSLLMSYGRGAGGAPGSMSSLLGGSLSPLDLLSAGSNPLASSAANEEAALLASMNGMGNKIPGGNNGSTDSSAAKRKQPEAETTDFGKLHKLALLSEMLSGQTGRPLTDSN